MADVEDMSDDEYFVRLRPVLYLMGASGGQNRRHLIWTLYVLSSLFVVTLV